MGLDQYLYAKQYLSPNSMFGETRNEGYQKVISAVGAEKYAHKELPSAEVSVKVGYWRKENAIHQWFVDNCQHGEDDCREYMVGREQLEELKKTCQMVLLDHQVTGTHDLAKEKLPTTSGFFFGSTDYDDWYYKGLEDTISIVNECLEMENTWDFYYQSSW